MKKILLSCILILTSLSLYAKKHHRALRSLGEVGSCALERGEQAYNCIKRESDPWYYEAPQNWSGYGEWFAGPMNRKYYGGNNAFPSPGRWIGAQW